MVVHTQITFGGIRSGLGGDLANIGCYGLLALVVWALLGPTTRAARWPGPIGWLARVRYDVWLPLHRITGLLLIAAMVRGLLQDSSLSRSAVLDITYLALCALGVAIYLYRELLMRFFLPEFAHTVEEVQRPAGNILVVTLAPQRDPVRLTPGQYVYAHFATQGWRPHPFTVAAADDAHRLRLAIQTAGNETTDLYETPAADDDAHLREGTQEARLRQTTHHLGTIRSPLAHRRRRRSVRTDFLDGGSLHTADTEIADYATTAGRCGTQPWPTPTGRSTIRQEGPRPSTRRSRRRIRPAASRSAGRARHGRAQAHRRREAQVRQVSAAGNASSRSPGIGSPQRRHRP